MTSYQTEIQKFCKKPENAILIDQVYDLGMQLSPLEEVAHMFLFTPAPGVTAENMSDLRVRFLIEVPELADPYDFVWRTECHTTDAILLCDRLYATVDEDEL